MTLLWHGRRPIGICVFTAPARTLRLRTRYFNLRHSSTASGGTRAGALRLKRLNEQLWLLARVVIHPTYRGAGVAAAFVKQSCAACPVPWIETLSAMGHVNPFFEKAGFVRVGVIRKEGRLSVRGQAQLYGGRRLSAETTRKSRYSEPVYYVLDNRRSLPSVAPAADKARGSSR